MSNKTRQLLLTVVVLPVGFGTYAYLVQQAHPTSDTISLGLLFAVVFFVFSLVNLVVEADATISPEMGAIATAFLTGGPAVAAIALGLGSLSIAGYRRRGAVRVPVTSAQYALSIAALTAIFGLFTGWKYGLDAIAQLLQGDWGFGLRFLAGMVIGVFFYVAINVGVLGEWVRLGRPDGKFPFGLMLSSDLKASMTFALLSIPVAMLVGRLGWALTALFAVPGVGVVWAGFQFGSHGGLMTVARRLTAFFTASVGLVFIAMAAVVLSTFSGRYRATVLKGQSALLRAYVAGAGAPATAGAAAAAPVQASASADAGASASVTATPGAAAPTALDSLLARLVVEDPSVAYVFVDDPARPGPASLHVGPGWSGSAPEIEAGLARERRAERRVFHFGGARALSVGELALAAGGAELRVGVDLSGVEEAQRRVGLAVGATTLLLYVLLLFLLRFYIRTQLTLPLGSANEALRGIAEGEADLTEGLPVVGDREIAELGRQFNRFVDNLSTLVASTSGTARSVVDGSQELAASTEELAASASEVSSSIEQAVGRMEQEREQTQALQGLTSVLARLNGEVTERTLAARREAEAAVAEVERSREGIGRAGDALLAVREVVQEADAAGGELIRASGRIGDLVQVIRDIAARTNLLALNAAIEAARAGEHGRGFAVVADEVRKLADGSARAAGEAGELIGQITTRADELASAMRRGAERVEGVERTAIESTEGLRLLVEAVHRIEAVIGDIAERMVREREAVAGVDAQVEDIQRLVRENAEMAGQVGAAAQEQTASTEQMTQLSTLLAQHAQELQELVGRFRVEERAAASPRDPTPRAEPALAYSGA